MFFLGSASVFPHAQGMFRERFVMGEAQLTPITEAEVSLGEIACAEPLSIAAGTQSGTVTRLKGRGIPHLRGRGRGDLFVHLQVATPTDLSEREVELLGELAELRGEHIEAPEHQGILSKIRSAFR